MKNLLLFPEGDKIKEMIGEESRFTEAEGAVSPGKLDASLTVDYRKGDFPVLKRTNLELKDSVDFYRHMNRIRRKVHNRDMRPNDPDF